VSLSAVDPLVSLAVGADATLDPLDEPKENSALPGAGVRADHTFHAAPRHLPIQVADGRTLMGNRHDYSSMLKWSVRPQAVRFNGLLTLRFRLARHVSARLGGCESVEEVSTRDHSCR
jgi:hypothetical protein